MASLKFAILPFILQVMGKKSNGESLRRPEVDSMIEKAFTNHCPFTERIRMLETTHKHFEEEQVRISAVLVKEHEQTHLSLQELALNLKRLCSKMDVEYLKP